MTKNRELDRDKRTALENMHKAFLEALRHREQEILRYIAILGPALAGFMWLLRVSLAADGQGFVFFIGTWGVIFLLLLGAIYSLTLGFNFRSMTLQLAKLESDSCLGIHGYMLRSWPRTPETFAARYRLWRIPYCAPPEIIKVFWLAFIIVIFGVMLAVLFLVLTTNADVSIGQTVALIIWGALCLVIALSTPIYFGWKLQKACVREQDNWKESTYQK